ncbi:MAG TPA: hypothetical protein VJM34_00515 [Novosphingobium sp.]|nr:hypothetical protein [Novosphingobium sp.]
MAGTLAAVLSLAGSCSGPRVVPTPAPSARPATRTPLPPPAPAVGWQDAPITPGDWQWRMIEGQSTATFAGGRLVLRCDRAARAVVVQLARTGGEDSARLPVPVSVPVTVTVTTSDQVRTISASPSPGPTPAIRAVLPAREPLLDAVATSRGRFAIEAPGTAPLYIPSWPEIGRVIEDCR